MQSIEVFYIIFGNHKFAESMHIKHSEIDVVIRVYDFLSELICTLT